MKKILLLLMFLYSVHVLAQKTSEKISIEFTNLSKKEILNMLEEKTPYTFYYIDNWLDAFKTSKKFNEVTIKEILNEVFHNSTLNYFITDDKKVILTNGNLIHKSVYEDIKKATITVTSKPVFIDQNKNDNNLIETVSIGKEIQGSRQKKYSISGIISSEDTGIPVENLIILE